MNDDLIIINSYPNTGERRNILRQCISQLKKTGKDLLLSTHFPADEQTYSMCDYYIYDSRNEMIYKDEYLENVMEHDDLPNFWFTCQHFDFRSISGNDFYHYFAIHQSMEMSFKFAKSLNKKYCYFIEGDSILHDDDLCQIDGIKQRVLNNNKLAYFQTNIGFDAYNTLFFFTELDFFLNNYTFAKNKKEFIELYKPRIFLESTIKKSFEKNDSLSMIETDEHTHTELKIFPNSLKTINQCDISEGTSISMQKSDLVVSDDNNIILLSICISHNTGLNYTYCLYNHGALIDTKEYSLNGFNHYSFLIVPANFDSDNDYRLVLTMTSNTGMHYNIIDTKINQNTEKFIRKMSNITWHTTSN